MRINTNVSAIGAYRNLASTQAAVGTSMTKLSSGFRINRAADDAAGLGIANRLRATTRSLTQASRNAEQTNSLLQIAEGATGTVQKMLERMKELATQAASDTVDADDRSKIQAEFEELQGEIARTVSSTVFGDKQLVDGSFGNKVDTSSTAVAQAAASDGTDADTVADKLVNVSLNGARAGTYTFTISTASTSASTIKLRNASGLEQTITVNQDVTTGIKAGDKLEFDKLGITVTLGEDFGHTAATAAASVAGKTADLTALNSDVITVQEGNAQFMVSASGDYGGNDAISLSNFDLSLEALGLTDASGTSQATLATRADAEAALSTVDSALTTVAETFGQIGAAQNRLEYAMDNIKTSIANLSAAESVIRDVDMAEEMTKFSKNQILQQAGTAMLAQANQIGQGVLQLLRG